MILQLGSFPFYFINHLIVMSKWIAFQEREPEDGREIFFCHKDQPPFVASGRVDLVNKNIKVENLNFPFNQFTHWQPVVEPTHIDLEGEEE